MAGIYIHIPFCRRACHYCDFHFTTNLKNSGQVVDAILKEIELQKNYLEGESIATIYFGGGTPSLLPTKDLNQIIAQISRLHSVELDAEITLEANPEDLTIDKLKELKSIGVNRLSLGTQSFIDSELIWMNRMHTSAEAEVAIKQAQNLGFNNISIDLIFGLPNQSENDWTFNLEKANSLNIQHVSSYGLTIEKKTVLESRIRKGEQKLPDEKLAQQFLIMNMDYLPKHGFEHYETSNYAQDGFISKHNSSYWKGKSYLGIGPSAHSFNGKSRQWNLSSNAAYCAAILQDKPYFESEILSEIDRLNEQIMIGLRTIWGVQKVELEKIRPGAWNEILAQVSAYETGYFKFDSDKITLTKAGVLLTDKLTSELFF